MPAAILLRGRPFHASVTVWTRLLPERRGGPYVTRSPQDGPSGPAGGQSQLSTRRPSQRRCDGLWRRPRRRARPIVTTDAPPAAAGAPASREDGTTHQARPSADARTAVGRVIGRPRPAARAGGPAGLGVGRAGDRLRRRLVVIFVSVLWQVVSRYVPALNWPGVGRARQLLADRPDLHHGRLPDRQQRPHHHPDHRLRRQGPGPGRRQGRVRGLHRGDLRPAGLGGLRADPGLSRPGGRPPWRFPIWILYAFPLVGFASGAVRAVVRIFHANRPDVVFDAAEAR